MKVSDSVVRQAANSISHRDVNECGFPSVILDAIDRYCLAYGENHTFDERYAAIHVVADILGTTISA